MLPPLNASKTLPPLTASGPTMILPPLSASSAALSATKTAPSVSVPALTLPTLLPPLRVALPPVDRSLPHWMDCLFWLSAKNGGGYIRVEDVDAVFRSGCELTPLKTRVTSSRMKRSTMPKLPALLTPMLPPLGTPSPASAVVPSLDGSASAAGSTVLPPLRASAAAVTLPPLRKVD